MSKSSLAAAIGISSKASTAVRNANASSTKTSDGTLTNTANDVDEMFGMSPTTMLLVAAGLIGLALVIRR